MKTNRVLYLFLSVFLISALFIYFGCVRTLKCNIYITEQMTKRNIYLPDTNASDIERYLSSSQDWYLIPRMPNGKLDHQSAYTASKSGKTVIAAYNPGSGKSGHLALINSKKPLFWSSNYNAYVPYASGSVRGRKAEITPLSYQFSPDKEPEIKYYVYIK